MTWPELSVVADLLGGFGVVVSLIYVSRQIKQNTRAVRMANASAVQNNFQETARFLYEDREGCAIILRGMSNPSELSPGERLSSYAWFFNLLKTAEIAYYHFLNGDLESSLWEASLTFYKAYFITPGFREYWARRRSAFIPEFQRAMDGWLQETATLERPDVLVSNAGEAQVSLRSNA